MRLVQGVQKRKSVSRREAERQASNVMERQKLENVTTDGHVDNEDRTTNWGLDTEGLVQNKLIRFVSAANVYKMWHAF